jgi:hypothetical protein
MKQLTHTLQTLLAFAAVLFFFLGTYACALVAASKTGAAQVYMVFITIFAMFALKQSLRLLVQIHNNK